MKEARGPRVVILLGAMSSLDPVTEEMFLGVATALFMNRLHVLRLTEIVRLQIRPSPDDGNMEVPDALDKDLQQQAIAYVLKCFPPTWHPKIHAAKAHWLSLD
jgi:hypothetical protein